MALGRGGLRLPGVSQPSLPSAAIVIPAVPVGTWAAIYAVMTSPSLAIGSPSR